MYTKVYNKGMLSLSDDIMSQSKFKVLRVLLYLSEPQGIRAVADYAELSPRGAALVLEELTTQGYLKKIKNKSNYRYKEQLSREDKELFFLIDKAAVKSRRMAHSAIVSKFALEKISWIPETLKTLAYVKHS